MLPVADYPVVVQYLSFAPPAATEGRPYRGGIDVIGFFTVGYGPKPEDVAKKLDASSFSYTMEFEKASFERLLLKIAYGCVVARFGLDKFAEIYMLDALMGRRDDIGLWLGCDDKILLSPTTFHGAATIAYGREVAARVRLFPPPAPEYLVVVARLTAASARESAATRGAPS